MILKENFWFYFCLILHREEDGFRTKEENHFEYNFSEGTAGLHGPHSGPFGREECVDNGTEGEDRESTASHSTQEIQRVHTVLAGVSGSGNVSFFYRIPRGRAIFQHCGKIAKRRYVLPNIFGLIISKIHIAAFYKLEKCL